MDTDADMATKTVRGATFLDKGGTGKTTTAAHFGVALAEQDHNVLIVDLAGKQNDLAEYFGLLDDWQAAIDADDDDDQDWPNIGTVFTDQWEQIARAVPDAAEQMIWETSEGPDIIPAHPDLDGVDDDLASVDQEDRYQRLNEFTTEHLEPMGYDVILFDLPGLTNNVSYNGLWAARNIIAPVEMGPLEEKQANGLRDDLDRIATNFDIELELTMVLPNKVDTRTNLAEEYLQQFEDAYPDAFAPAYVPVSQDIRNACNQGKTVFALDKPSKTAEEAIEAYRVNAKAFYRRLTGGE
ncbi:ParA family protein [Halorussus marinus]|uniref:ParA family protein n=1 Tax=Halorussus marinus TaxID=2505976 RepID=UPI001FCE8100|nr:ParA family protein [Halorussus marinus]